MGCKLMKVENKCWYKDYLRTTDDDNFILSHFIRDYLTQQRLRFIIFFRNYQNTNNKLAKLFYHYKLFRLSRKYGIEIPPTTKIGKGFVMIHPYNITINSEAILGDNINIMKGATIGLSRGKKDGVPTIGNCVYIGLNSTIIGGIKIGDDVMIAPNTLVNTDVPSHSVVIGSPCKIIPKQNATKQYVFYKV